MHNDLEPYPYRNMRSFDEVNKQKKTENLYNTRHTHMGPVVLIKHKFLFLMICLFFGF